VIVVNLPPTVVFFTAEVTGPPGMTFVIADSVELTIVQVPVPEHAPVQPSNMESGPGVAARVTLVPEV